LTNLSEFICNSYHSECFYQLSQICHKIQSLFINLNNDVSDGLKRLISSQNNLKSLCLSDNNYLRDIIPDLTNLHETLTSLHLCTHNEILSFVASFRNLQDLIISSSYKIYNELQHIIFPNLQSFAIIGIRKHKNPETFGILSKS